MIECERREVYTFAISSNFLSLVAITIYNHFSNNIVPYQPNNSVENKYIQSFLAPLCRCWFLMSSSQLIPNWSFYLAELELTTLEFGQSDTKSESKRDRGKWLTWCRRVLAKSWESETPKSPMKWQYGSWFGSLVGLTRTRTRRTRSGYPFSLTRLGCVPRYHRLFGYDIYLLPWSNVEWSNTEQQVYQMANINKRLSESNSVFSLEIC